MNTCEVDLVERKIFCHTTKEYFLSMIKRAIRISDIKQRIQNIFTDFWAVSKNFSNLTRISFETCNIFLRQLIYTSDVALLTFRYAANTVKSIYFHRGNNTICLCHFCRQSNKCDSESNFFIKLTIKCIMTGNRPRYSSQRPA